MKISGKRIRLGEALLALALFFILGLGPMARPVPGLQCPTAPPQTVTECLRNCCGHVVGYQTRNLRPGDKGFVQCQCSAKSAAQVKIYGAALQLGLSVIPPAVQSMAIRPVFVGIEPALHWITRSQPPLDLPPNA